MCDVYIINIDRRLQNTEYAGLIQLVSEGKAARLARFHHFEDSQRSLLGDVLARYAISLKSGIKNSRLIFETNEYGKPLLKEPCTVHFNISHSGNWVVCALDNAPVGIDVEETGPVDLKIAEKFFSKDEYTIDQRTCRDTAGLLLQNLDSERKLHQGPRPGFEHSSRFLFHFQNKQGASSYYGKWDKQLQVFSIRSIQRSRICCLHHE